MDAAAGARRGAGIRRLTAARDVRMLSRAQGESDGIGRREWLGPWATGEEMTSASGRAFALCCVLAMLLGCARKAGRSQEAHREGTTSSLSPSTSDDGIAAITKDAPEPVVLHEPDGDREFAERFVSMMFETNDVLFVRANTDPAAVKEESGPGSGLEHAVSWCGEIGRVKQRMPLEVVGTRYFHEADVASLQQSVKKMWWKEQAFADAIQGGIGAIVTCKVGSRMRDTLLVFKRTEAETKLVYLADD